MNISQFKDYILSNESVLMDQALAYAKRLNFVKYTSTLTEAWRKSIDGLSKDMLHIFETYNGIIELGPDNDYANHPIAAYGVRQAISHRTRGVNLSMFLGMMKYYCQSYVDLIEESDFSYEDRQSFIYIIRRYFDFVELGFITEWTGLSEEVLVNQLQDGNRTMTNEKNKYLTVFESIYDPVILFDEKNRVININSKAADIFLGNSAPGAVYYNTGIGSEISPEWLHADLVDFSISDSMEKNSEKHVQIRDEEKTFLLKFKKMLDISDKYAGTVVILNDITERIATEKTLKEQQLQLERHAYTDPLTGVANRRTGYILMEQAFKQLTKNERTMCLCYIDIDGLKKVNDTYGHMQGDELINFIVSSIQKIIRSDDHLIRMGGDEFIILFNDCAIAESADLISQIETILEEFDKRELLPYKHSFSYGLIELDAKMNPNIINAIREADEKMYKNKLFKKNNLIL